MKRIKENVLTDFVEMIKHSWTWARLTEDEQKRFLYNLGYVKVKGTWEQRWEVLNELYYFFLEGLGYKPCGWREPDEEAPQF